MKDKSTVNGGGEGVCQDKGSLKELNFSSQLQLKVRQANIAILRITTLEDYRSHVLKDEIENFNIFLTNLNSHGEEFHDTAVLMKYDFLK